ncbi:MAG TPA: aromatic amino acid transport family protein [Steroidobacteraceae bacterium]|nr:aromatic amino acid transport family protein [Steroidobacteraceae bacterium]
MAAARLSTARGILVFSSTIIGAGILALPVIASGAGFLPLAVMIFIMAVVSALSGLYIAEAVLADREPLHLPTLAGRHLGPWGARAMFAGIMVYTYGALLGYLAAGGQIIFTLAAGAIPVWLGTLIYFALASLIVHRGMVAVSRVNTYFMYVMLVLFAILIALAAPKVQVPLLARSDWRASLDVFGIVLFAYLGHSVIPSIAFNLADRTRIVTVIAVGIALPGLLYLLWSLTVVGVVPATAANGNSLSAALAAGQPATIPLGYVLGGSVIVLGNVFAALSTMTSFIGFGVSLKDSYAELAEHRRRAVPGLALTGLVVVPPLIVSLLKPDAFDKSLAIAGTFGGGLFVGILPALIVTRLRRADAQRPYTWARRLIPYVVLSVYVLGMVYGLAESLGWL